MVKWSHKKCGNKGEVKTSHDESYLRIEKKIRKTRRAS